jgi:hypothetical protein
MAEEGDRGRSAHNGGRLNRGTREGRLRNTQLTSVCEKESENQESRTRLLEWFPVAWIVKMRRLVSTERVKLIAKCEELLDQLRDHEDNAKLRALTDDIEKLCD